MEFEVFAMEVLHAMEDDVPMNMTLMGFRTTWLVYTIENPDPESWLHITHRFFGGYIGHINILIWP